MKSMGGVSSGLRLERMRASPRWDGLAFCNLHPILPGLQDPSVRRPSLGEFLCGGERRIPRAPLSGVDPRALWGRPPGSGLRATWLGHSTVLLEMDGVRILTDPVWGPRASPSRLIGPKRFQPVPVALRELPPIDLVVVSHDHYDHLDYPTVRELAASDVPFVTSLGVGAHLEAWGIAAARIHELDWWESYRLPNADLSVTAAPSQHFSGRGLRDRNATLWSSMVLRSARHSVFFSGDTGLTTEYEAIHARLGPFELVMLEVGAFHPSWGHIHLGPQNALKALELLGGGAVAGALGHLRPGDARLGRAGRNLAGTRTAARCPAVDATLGEPVEPAHEHELTPWWRAVDAREPRRRSPALRP
jgi:L-ascorbate metabolism protein UlaG (beta-lactamase superfamily)